MATIPADDNEFPKVLFAEGAAPGTPAAGLAEVYFKSDSLPYFKNDLGVETAFGTGDTAGHIADTTDAHDASAVSFDPTGLGNTSATELQTAMEDFDAAITAAGGVSAVQTALTAGPITIVNANTYYDVVSASMAAGTYLVFVAGLVKINGNTGFVFLRLWDGSSAIYAEAEHFVGDAGELDTVSFPALVVLGSTTTVKLSAAASVGSSAATIEETLHANGTTEKATRMVALRIA